MSLHFQNNYSNTVYVAVLFYNTGCGAANQNFSKAGWYAVNSGQTIVPNIAAIDGDLRNGNARAYFFANSAGATWSGPGNPSVMVPVSAAFDSCAFDTFNPQQEAAFIDIEFEGFADVTVILGPGAGVFNIVRSSPPPPPPHSDHSDGWGGGGGDDDDDDDDDDG